MVGYVLTSVIFVVFMVMSVRGDEVTDGAGRSTPDKKKWIHIVLAVTIVACVVGAFISAVFNSPRRKLLRAIEEKQYNEASKIIDEDNSVADDKEIIDNIMSRIEDIKELFMHGEVDFDTARTELGEIRKIGVNGVASALDEVNDYVLRVHNSRTQFAAAEKCFEEELYPEAMVRYRSVIEEDGNYEKAKERIAESVERYRDQLLSAARVEAEEQRYQDAIGILEDALLVLADDEILTKQVQTYQEADEEKKRQEKIAEAANLAERGLYVAAVSALDAFLKDHVSDSEVKKIRQEYYDHYINKVISDVDERIVEADYIEALTMLTGALRSYPEDTTLLAKKTEAENLDIQRIAQNAKEKMDAEEFRGAIELLEDGLKKYKNEEMLEMLLAADREKHIQYLLDKAASHASKEEYAEAVAIVIDGMAFYPNDNRLVEKRTAYEAKLPVPLNDIHVVNGSFQWNKGAPEDPFGNDYSTAANYFISKSGIYDRGMVNSEYVEVRLYGGYKRITGTVAPHNDMEPDGGGYIQIYADDKLLFTSQTLVRKTDAFDFSVDLVGTDYLKFVVRTGVYTSAWSGRGALIVSNVLLYPN